MSSKFGFGDWSLRRRLPHLPGRFARLRSGMAIPMLCALLCAPLTLTSTAEPKPARSAAHSTPAVLDSAGWGRAYIAPPSTPPNSQLPPPPPPSRMYEPPPRPALFTAPPPRRVPPPPTGIYLAAPNVQQAYPLDCEAAALQVALAAKGINVTQQWIFNALPQDPRPAVMSGGKPVQWGDPYTSFVGNVNGHEYNYTGYGVYYGPIASVAAQAGAQADAHTGWTVGSIENEIRLGNPVVVWVNASFAATGVSWWTAFDGAAIPYTTVEHAVTVIGFDPGRGTITIVDVRYGTRHTFTNQAFSAALSTFGGMGVAVSAPAPSTPTPSPSPTPSPTPTPTPTPSPTPSPTATPAPTPTPKPTPKP